MNFLSECFSLYVTLPSRGQCQVPMIRFVPKTLHQTLVNFTVFSPGYRQTRCLWWEAVESWFHLDLKSFFPLKNNSLGFLLGHINRWINVIYESRMKWTWHYSQVHFSWGKFPPQTQCGTPSIINTRWRSWHDGLRCHSPMLSLPWIIPGAPLIFNGVPGNIQRNLTGLHFELNWKRLVLLHSTEGNLIYKPQIPMPKINTCQNHNPNSQRQCVKP